MSVRFGTMNQTFTNFHITLTSQAIINAQSKCWDCTCTFIDVHIVLTSRAIINAQSKCWDCTWTSRKISDVSTAHFCHKDFWCFKCHSYRGRRARWRPLHAASLNTAQHWSLTSCTLLFLWFHAGKSRPVERFTNQQQFQCNQSVSSSASRGSDPPSGDTITHSHLHPLHVSLTFTKTPHKNMELYGHTWNAS